MIKLLSIVFDLVNNLIKTKIKRKLSFLKCSYVHGCKRTRRKWNCTWIKLSEARLSEINFCSLSKTDWRKMEYNPRWNYQIEKYSWWKPFFFFHFKYEFQRIVFHGSPVILKKTLLRSGIKLKISPSIVIWVTQIFYCFIIDFFNDWLIFFSMNKKFILIGYIFINFLPQFFVFSILLS